MKQALTTEGQRRQSQGELPFETLADFAYYEAMTQGNVEHSRSQVFINGLEVPVEHGQRDPDQAQ